MRLRAYPTWLGAALALAGACSVPEKQPSDDIEDPDPPGGPQMPGGDGPMTVLDQVPEVFSALGQATFRFSSTDPTATFQCRIDSEAAQPCQSPYVRTLADGLHNFSVRAVINGNSDDTPAEHVWTIDTVPPNTMLVSGPPIADNSVMVQFVFRSNEDNTAFDCSLDNAGFLPCVSNTMFGPIGDGIHMFVVRARDRAGNIDASPPGYSWAVDLRTPDTQIITAMPEATASTSASFDFVSPDAGDGHSFQCSIDGGDFAPCMPPVVYTDLREGTHTFAVRVRDAVGNLDPSPATRTWRVDVTAPNTEIADGPDGTVALTIASFAFSSNEAGTFQCSLDGAPFAACESPASFTGLAQGAHSFAVRAVDLAGHIDQSAASRTWSVDTVAPDIMIVSGPGESAVVGPRVVIGFSVSEGEIACRVDGGGYTGCGSPFAANLPAGNHALTIRAIDGAGTETELTRNFTVACAPASPDGAAGVLHLDTADQTLANAVAGGAPATLGDTAEPEPGDPEAFGGRFAGGLAFTAADSDHVAWPIALGGVSDLTIELWARPNAAPGARDIALSGDGRVALRITGSRFSFAINEGPAGETRVATSGEVSVGAWHHVIASLQGGALRLWVDGARSDGPAVALAAPLALDSLRLGGAGFDGVLDEVWVAQTAIAADETALQRFCPL